MARTLRGLPAEPHVTLSVTDTGMGMAPAVLARLFTPGFSTRGHEGAGLGLVSVQQCVYRSGGTIDVQSSPGQGTVIMLHWKTTAS